MKKPAAQEAISLTDRLAGLLRSNRIGLTTVIAIADALAADARYNMWFYDNVKSRASESEAITRLDEYGRLTDACTAAIERFDLTDAEKVDKDRSMKELKELEAALETFSNDTAEAMVIAF